MPASPVEPTMMATTRSIVFHAGPMATNTNTIASHANATPMNPTHHAMLAFFLTSKPPIKPAMATSCHTDVSVSRSPPAKAMMSPHTQSWATKLVCNLSLKPATVYAPPVKVNVLSTSFAENVEADAKYNIGWYWPFKKSVS